GICIRSGRGWGRNSSPWGGCAALPTRPPSANSLPPNAVAWNLPAAPASAAPCDGEGYAAGILRGGCGTTPARPPLASPSQREDVMGKRTNEVIARYEDGSAVHVELLQEELEIETRYGRLTVPVAEIRRVEFGLHLPEPLRGEIAAVVKELTAESSR